MGEGKEGGGWSGRRGEITTGGGKREKRQTEGKEILTTGKKKTERIKAKERKSSHILHRGPGGREGHDPN